jgi:hypothetical protein
MEGSTGGTEGKARSVPDLLGVHAFKKMHFSGTKGYGSNPSVRTRESKSSRSRMGAEPDRLSVPLLKGGPSELTPLVMKVTMSASLRISVTLAVTVPPRLLSR